MNQTYQGAARMREELCANTRNCEKSLFYCMESSIQSHVNVQAIFSDIKILQLTKSALATETGKQESAQKSC